MMDQKCKESRHGWPLYVYAESSPGRGRWTDEIGQRVIVFIEMAHPTAYIYLILTLPRFK
jgi:hypothetical protein